MRPPLYSLLLVILSLSVPRPAHALPEGGQDAQPPASTASAKAAPGPAAKSGQGKGAFGVKYIGEPGSSYSQPSGAAADVLETASRQAGGQGTFGPIGSDGKPSQEASAGKPSVPEKDVPAVGAPKNQAPKQGVAAGAAAVGIPSRDATSTRDAVAAPSIPSARPAGVSASAAAKEVSGKPEDRSRYSLWDGLTGPADIKDPKIKEADEALKGSEAGGSAQSNVPQTAPQAAPAAGTQFLVEPFAVKGSEGKLGEIFVRFELDLAKAAQSAPAQALVAKDAVAELGRVAGFREDAKSEETLRDAVSDRFSVRGWMPSDRIAAAMRVPGVAMLKIEPQAARPSYGAHAVTDILVGIRVPKDQGLGADGEYSAVLRRLQAETGFELKKTIGVQEVPGGKDPVVVVSGRIPVRSISKALSLNGVVKIASSPDAGAPLPPTGPAQRRGFLGYALSRSPLLVAATLIVLLSPLSLGLFRFLQVLSPYRQQ